MKRKHGLKMARGECHECAPKEWRKTPNLTGDYDLDETIMHRHNGDMPKRLKVYTKDSKVSYGNKTGYNGYRGYSGDD